MFFEFIRPFMIRDENPIDNFIGNGIEIYEPCHGAIYKDGTSDIHPVELGFFLLDKFIYKNKEILAFVIKEKIDDWTFFLPMDNDFKKFKVIEMKFNINISKHNSESVRKNFKEFMENEGIDIQYV